jgi:pimeloyl-ACP methyl ester carboxylesterase
MKTSITLLIGGTAKRVLLRLALGLATVAAVFASDPGMPPSFKTQMVRVPDGAEIFVRSGGSGPGVVLLHGFADTGDMWGPLAAELMKNYTVIVPDLRGMGKSSHPPGGYTKKAQAEDIRAVIASLGFDRAAVVGHDIGNMVAYAYTAKYRDKVDRLVVMDAPIPGVADWEQSLLSPQLWHFSFGGPDAERLVQGRERIYLDRFWNEFSVHPDRIDESTRVHYAALYALPGAMHSSFEQFHAFAEDARDNQASAQVKLTMPVLAVGGEKSYATGMAAVMRQAATDVREAVVPDAGHWLMEENPAFTVALISGFLRERESSASDRRITPDEFQSLPSSGPGTGTSGVGGIQTVVLKGNPVEAGLYTILLRVPAHTKIAVHDHPDDRVAVVISGTWFFGYGEQQEATRLKALPAGSVYTEPPHRPHFAETRDDPVVVQITGYGPSGTRYFHAVDDPRRDER